MEAASSTARCMRAMQISAAGEARAASPVFCRGGRNALPAALLGRLESMRAGLAKPKLGAARAGRRAVHGLGSSRCSMARMR
jgi:hypothetical protein